MISNKCTICHNEETILHKIVFPVDKENKIISIRQCHQCKNHYTYFDTDIDLNEYYDEKDYALQDTKKTIFFQIQKSEYSRVLKKIKKLNSLHSPSLLDFGSGKGLLLHFAHQLNFSVKGIETSLPRANYARENFNVEVNTVPFSEGNIFNSHFDTITCFHVLEHLSQPSLLFNNLIKDNLKSKGLVVVEVPNFRSWQAKWSGKNWLQLDVPRHLSHFTSHELKKIVEQANCSIIHEEYFSLHLGIIGMVQTVMQKFGYRGFLMADLKHNRKKSLLVKVILSLPLAIILELTASMFKRGGIIRFYAVKNS